MTPFVSRSLVACRWSFANSRTVNRLHSCRRLRTTNDQRPTTILYLLRAARKRQQRDIARLLDGPRQTALVRCAHARQASRSYLPALRYELGQQTHIFVIDRFDLLDAELANLLAPEELAAAFTGTAGTSAGTRTTWRPAALGAVTTTTLRTAFAAT